MIVITPGRVRHVDIFGGATGSIGATVANASPRARFTWTSTGTPVPPSHRLEALSGLAAGSYRLLVEDGEDTAGFTYVVTQNRPLRIHPGAVTDVMVYGKRTGEIGRTTMSGGNGTYTPYWTCDVPDLDLSDDHSLQAKRDLPAGTFTVRIVDGTGAEARHVYVVRQSAELKIKKGAVRNATLNGRTAGSIAPSVVTGGQPPYTFSWVRSTGGTDIPIDLPMNTTRDSTTISTARELRPGAYGLTVRDAVGAVVRASYRVREGPNKTYFEFAGTRNFYRCSD